MITIRSREGFVQGGPDGFADDEFTAARGQEVTGRGEYLLGKDAGVSLLCLELQPILGTREVGDQVKELLLLGDIPAVLYDQIKSSSGLEDLSDVLILFDVAETLDPAALPYLHPSVLRLGVQVEEDTLRSQRSMYPLQGVDHALESDASQRVSQDCHVESVRGESEGGDIGHDEAHPGPERCGGSRSRSPDLLRVRIQPESRGDLVCVPPGHPPIPASHFEHISAREIDQIGENTDLAAFRIDRMAHCSSSKISDGTGY